ncbi:hypothetical protein AOQ71_26055 [Bradyrhizobium manausense]|uniref:Uncharacterized protein n=1 Tax=Bradyrhizobium manausense TaxID=989370 RepID=A0A0R3DDW1_9BRAD|nr:hypothetical protein AOQ71_26055 [Bradyrhizobium manausense]
MMRHMLHHSGHGACRKIDRPTNAELARRRARAKRDVRLLALVRSVAAVATTAVSMLESSIG